MLLPVFLALCVGLATSLHVNEIHRAEPDFLDDDHCKCTKEPIPQCGCCYDFEFQEKSHKVCANVTYIKGVKGMRLTVTLDGKVLLDETLSAKNPPPFCQGIKPFAYICEKYSNMSYGDDNKWGGCLEIYGGVIIQILDVKFGCFYLPVDTQEVRQEIAEKPALAPSSKSFRDFIKGTIVEGIKQWHGRTESERLHKGHKGSLKKILLKNRVDGEENEDVGIN